MRVDSGVRAGDEISGLYDPMIAKLIVHDTNRETARRRMLRALAEFRIEGPPTLIGFHAALLDRAVLHRGRDLSRARRVGGACAARGGADGALSHRTTRRSAGAGRQRRRASALVAVEVDGRAFDVRLHTTEPPWAALGRRRRERRGVGGRRRLGRRRRARCRERCSRSLVADGDAVAAGQVLCVVEAMKMENEIAAPHDGVVSELGVAAGQGVTSGQLICVVASAGMTDRERRRRARRPARRRRRAHRARR